MTNFPRELCEQALAHVIAEETEAAYRRSDALAKRRRLMDEWAAYCMPNDSTRTGILRVLEETMNLRALVYDPADNHKELADSVAALASKVETAREQIAKTAGW
jgi:hypothetical protein